MREILATIAIKNSGSCDIEERVETPSFIFKDSCSRGVKSMRGLCPVSALLFVHDEKTAPCSLLKTSIVAEMMARAIGRRGVRKWQAFMRAYERTYKQGRTQIYTHGRSEPSVLREITRPH